MQISLDDIKAAADRIAGGISPSPFLLSKTLSSITGAEIFIKFENLQFTASFKERGALNRLALLSAQQIAKGVVAVSAGNHAQGVAYHAQRLRIPAVIVMPEATPFVKVKHTQEYGASVVLEGRDLNQSFEAARKYVADGLTLVHPYDDPAVIAGQGTIGLEIALSGTALDDLVVPIGGGGLITGVAIALRALMKGTRIIGVRSEYYPHFERQAQPVPVARKETIAEGIAVKEAGEIALALAPTLIDEILVAPEADIERAVSLLITVEKTVAEGAGAAALAAVLSFPEKFRGRRVGLILSGGNIDTRILAQVLMRGLVREGRIARIRIEIADTPGTLAKVASMIGDAGGNIVEVSHQRTFAHVSVKNAWLDVAVEARDSEHMRGIVNRLTDGGFAVSVLD